MDGIKFREFADEIIDRGLEASLDGAYIQDLAVKHGLLKVVTMDKPCCEGCQCKDIVGEDGFPTGCYRKTYTLATEWLEIPKFLRRGAD